MLLNPNTGTCPVFRTGADAEIAKKLYRRVPILQNDQTEKNSWGIKNLLMFMMNTDSHLFRADPDADLVPLYESKLFWQFDHRYATYEGATQAQLNAAILPQLPVSAKISPTASVRPRYWVTISDVRARVGAWNREWVIAFRKITGPVLERTGIFTILPLCGVGDSALIILPEATSDPRLHACLLANLNSLVFDYMARQKIGGVNFNFFALKQLPAIAPETYSDEDVGFIAPRVTELLYTATDLKAFAADIGYNGSPFVWDEIRRATLRGDLDAYYAHLYGLTRDELRYILDPKDVFGSDFPSETFRVLKEHEEKEFGEYRTGRLVLEAFDKLADSSRFRDEMPKRVSTITPPAIPAKAGQ